MRKVILATVVVAILAVGTVVTAGPELFGGLPIVNVVVNGRTLSVPGVVVEGRSMAPVRAMAESLGGEVVWDQATFTASITAPDLIRLQAENTRLKAEVAELKARLQPAPPPVGGPVSTRTNPGAIGTAQTIFVKNLMDDYTAHVTVLEVLRGEPAWEKVKAANLFNEQPDAGTEYVAVRIRFEVGAVAGDKAVNLSDAQFQAISSSGREYDAPLIVPPAPPLATKLYGGATHEGWAVFAVAKDDEAPLLTFGRRYDGTGGIWFKLSE